MHSELKGNVLITSSDHGTKTTHAQLVRCFKLLCFFVFNSFLGKLPVTSQLLTHYMLEVALVGENMSCNMAKKSVTLTFNLIILCSYIIFARKIPERNGQK